MPLRIRLGFFLLICPLAGLATGADDPKPWLEVRSPHFTVITNGSEKQARRVLERFEEIRAVFHVAFPRMRLDPSAPIIIFATKDEKTFRALAPLDFMKKGRARVGGFFMGGADKNLVLVRLDLDAENLYDTVFHEYTHVILNQNMKSLPVWLGEGLAGYYGSTRILDKEIHLGFPSEYNVAILRNNVSLPIETLLQVDHSSPHYNQQDKGTIFYAQSWALTHYLMIQRAGGGTNPLVAYIVLLDQGVNPLQAAQRAFGDLGKLRNELDNYIRGLGFHYHRLKSSVRTEDLVFTAQPLALPASDAWRGDFLVHVQRYDDAKTLLNQAIEQDPSNAQARESLGLMALAQIQLPEAAKWFSEAAQLDSRSYLAHYYHAMMREKEGNDDQHLAEAEASLMRSTDLNSNFAPAYGALASVMGRRGKDLKTALGVARRAIQLEPGVQGYQLIAARIQVELGEGDAARQTVDLVIASAQTPETRAEAQALLVYIQQYQVYVKHQKEAEERNRAEEVAFKKRAEEMRAGLAERQKREQAEAEEKTAQLTQQVPLGKGKAGWSAGKITSVSCKTPPGLELTLRGSLKSARLHAVNYFKIEFLATAWQAPTDFNPCQHLRGHEVAISYQSFEGSPYDGEIVSVEVRK